jgi:hypothetical protein
MDTISDDIILLIKGGYHCTIELYFGKWYTHNVSSSVASGVCMSMVL